VGVGMGIGMRIGMGFGIGKGGGKGKGKKGREKVGVLLGLDCEMSLIDGAGKGEGCSVGGIRNSGHAYVMSCQGGSWI